MIGTGAVAVVAVSGACIAGAGGTGPEDPVAASVTSGARSVGIGATTEDWRGTGLSATAIDPRKFATGSCMAFTSPRGASRSETVFIDAGHGGIDPGGTGTTSGGAKVGESQVNLSVVLDAMRVLTSDGYRVVLSRTGQTTVVRLGPDDTDNGLLSVKGAEDDIAARDECANLAHADLLAGIYMNAGSADEAGSVTTYDAVRPFAKGSQRFASLLQSDVLGKVNATGAGVPDGGVLDDTSMGSTLSSSGHTYGHLMLLGPAYPPGGFTTPSKMPGALIEPLFLSDPSEASIADSSRGQHLVAAGLAEAVEGYFK
ncbi:MAG: N-acetylmuramoyl-L-alanine amidase [Streptosporangiales bacterium]|nr:N-acetylmuramoyl-L-alanine amidase [Streptosporangiales bacterium]